MELHFPPRHFALARRDLYSCAVVAIVGVSAFILGTLADGEEGHGVVIENARGDFLAAPSTKSNTVPTIATNAVQAVSAQTTAGAFIASQNGEVYYPPGCKGASRIQEKNRITFASAALAEGAGYRIAKACE